MTYFIQIYGKETIKKELDAFLDTFHYNQQEALAIDFTFFKGYIFSHRTLVNMIQISYKIKNKPFDEAFRNIFRSQTF